MLVIDGNTSGIGTKFTNLNIRNGVDHCLTPAFCCNPTAVNPMILQLSWRKAVKSLAFRPDAEMYLPEKLIC